MLLLYSVALSLCPLLKLNNDDDDDDANTAARHVTENGQHIVYIGSFIS